MPITFNADCLAAAKKLICSVAFLPPQYEVEEVVQDSTLVTLELYVPMFPHYSRCLDFKHKCKKLIEVAGEALDLNCTERVVVPPLNPEAATVYQFPVTNQTVAYAFGVLPVQSDPNYVDAAVVNFTTVCPRGFSIPADLDAPGQLMVTDACAVNCPAPVYTAAQQAQTNKALATLSWFNTIFGCLQVTNLIAQHPERKNKLITISIVVTLSTNMYDAFQRAIVKDPSRLICASNTAWHTIEIGSRTTETGTNAALARSCNFFALLVVYTEFIFYWCALAIFIELWLKVWFNVHHLPQYRKVYFFVGLFLAVLNALVVTFYGDPKMVTPGTFLTKCDYSIGETYTDFYLRFMPHIIVYAISAFLGAHVLAMCFERTYSVGYHPEDNPLMKLWHQNSILFYYLFLFIIAYGPTDIWLSWYLNLHQAPQLVDSFIAWTTCVFENFVTADDQAVVDSVCGIIPDYTIPVFETVTLALVGILYNVVLFLITLDRDSQDFWKMAGVAVLDFFFCRPVKLYTPNAVFLAEDYDVSGKSSIKMADHLLPNGRTKSANVDYAMYYSKEEGRLKSGSVYDMDEVVRASEALPVGESQAEASWRDSKMAGSFRQSLTAGGRGGRRTSNAPARVSRASTLRDSDCDEEEHSNTF
jgi:hypothetical protein